MQQRPRGKRLLLVLALTLALLSLPINQVDVAAANNPSGSNVTTQLSAITSFVGLRDSATEPNIAAKSFLLVDANTVTTLASRNPESVLPIASTTKIMTALVARQYFDLNDVVTIHSEAEQIPETLVHLVPGEKINVLSLLKAMLMPSGNDAAYSLGYFYADKLSLAGEKPSLKPFVDKMNDYAASHNLTNTRYGDTAGLDDDNGHSTAKDLSNIARLLLADPILSEIVSTPETVVSSVDSVYIHKLTNSNRLIQAADPLYLPNVLGIKTGFTLGAGHCLVAAYNFNGRALIGIVLNTNVYSATASAEEMRKLLLWASSNVQINNY